MDTSGRHLEGEGQGLVPDLDTAESYQHISYPGDSVGGEGARGKWRGKKLGRGIKCITDKVERDVCEEEMEERKEGELTEKKEEREESKERKEREEREEWRRRRSERKSRKEMIGRRGGRVGGGRNGEEGGREDTKEREEERRVRIWEGRQGEE